MVLADILQAALESRLEAYHWMQLAAFIPKPFKAWGYEANPREGWAVLHLSSPRKILGRARDSLDINDGSVHRASVDFDNHGKPIAVYLFSK